DISISTSFILSFCYCSCARRYLYSFPTRRSSDLSESFYSKVERDVHEIDANLLIELLTAHHFDVVSFFARVSNQDLRTEPNFDRSEEHTSELQSRFDLVCRLLLEKKKKKTIYNKC